MAALVELEEAYPRITALPAFQNELNDLLEHYAGRPTPLFFARRTTDDLGGAKVYLKREDLAHTGAHKINNVLGQCLLAKHMGKHAHHRGDRRGPARRRDGDRVRAARPRVRGLHGRRGRRAPGAERLPHGAARRARDPGDVGLEDAEGRHQRGDARLGHQRRDHLLLHRLGDGPASVSDDRARLPARDRRRGAPPDPRDGAQAARRAGRLRRRRLERDGPLPSVPRRRVGEDDRRRAGRGGHRHRPPRRDARRRA